MTSTTDTTGHPDVSEISDLTEGLLPPARAAEVRQHLDACELCADVHASLEEIRGLLGAVPGPVRMPADVAGRIDAALAAEALLSATIPEAHVSRETSPRQAPAPENRPAGRPSATTGPGRKDQKGRRNQKDRMDRLDRPDRGRGRRRRTVVLGTVFTAAVLGAGALFLQSLGGDGTTTAQGTPTSSAGTFSKGTLQHQVNNLLDTKKNLPRGSQKPFGVESQPSESATTATPYTTRIDPSESVPVCVREGVGQTGDVIGAKKGTYQGKSAYLLVLPDSSDASRVTAFVVDATCVGKAAASPGKVLLTESLTRP
ncbi:anti-sigma factor family protein [Streptomyces humi]|uniref:anti-sigma factor family protein n=1 Tax=Streptomyces humi TaxID=1428620 RepID=UPI0006288C34|nr:membrane protein [Streptomyces humi]